jgi:hypothetical protein
MQIGRRFGFNVHRSPFAVRRSPFAVRRSPFAVRRSPFAIQRSTFNVQRSTSFDGVSSSIPDRALVMDLLELKTLPVSPRSFFNHAYRPNAT